MASTKSNVSASLPWYRQFWPWVLVGIPVFAVVSGLATVLIAISTSDGLVVDDYYKQGLAINRILARDHEAVTLGIRALVRFDIEGGMVHIQLRRHKDNEHLESLTVSLLHPTRANQDVHLAAKHNGYGSFTGALPPLATGRWHLQIEPQTRAWRLSGRVALPGERAVQLGATP